MNGLSMFAAFIAGGACGFIGAKVYFEKKYKNMAEEEIAEMRAYYDEKNKNLDNLKEAKEAVAAEKKEYHRHVENYISSAPLDEDRGFRAVGDVSEETEHPEDDIPDEQFPITAMDFFDDSEYDKCNVTYYANDHVFVGLDSDGNESIFDIRSTVGEDAIEMIRNGFDDGSALYIRNPNNSTDYEITKSYISYKEMMIND